MGAVQGERERRRLRVHRHAADGFLRGGATIERGGQAIKLGIPQHMRELATTIIPLGRAGTPREAAGAIFFLCSPWSRLHCKAEVQR